MNHSTLQFPDLFIATTSSTTTTTTSYPPHSPLPPPPHQQEAKEYVDQRIIPHRLQIGLGIQNGAHGSLYKCHTLYLEYKSLLQQLQQRQEQQEEEEQPLRLLLQRTQRQLITELCLQQLEFQKLVMLQQSRRNEIIALQQHNKEEENSNSMDVVTLSVVPNHTDTDHKNNDHPTNVASFSTKVQQLRQRFHQVQQLHSCYQEYDAILQVLYGSICSDGKLPTNSSTLNPSTTTTTTAMSMPPPPPHHQQQQQQSSSSLTLRNGNNSNEILQNTYDTLVRDKQMIQDQIFNSQQQEIQLRKQQLHLLQQTIQDMKHRYVPTIQE